METSLQPDFFADARLGFRTLLQHPLQVLHGQLIIKELVGGTACRQRCFQVWHRQLRGLCLQVFGPNISYGKSEQLICVLHVDRGCS